MTEIIDDWKTSRPTEPGFYWRYDRKTEVMEFVEVWRSPYNGTLYVIGLGEEDDLPDNDDVFNDLVWHGPIFPPDPPRDPALLSFLDCLDKQMATHPELIVEADEAQLERIAQLVEGVELENDE